MIPSQITKTQTTNYSASYEIKKNGISKEIQEPLITTDAIATARATAEFLEYGYDKQTVEFTTFFSPLKLNEIISISAPEMRIPKDLDKDRFIVKNVKHSFSSGYMKTTVKAIRYD